MVQEEEALPADSGEGTRGQFGWGSPLGLSVVMVATGVSLALLGLVVVLVRYALVLR
jgi:hypothetical protein